LPFAFPSHCFFFDFLWYGFFIWLIVLEKKGFLFKFVLVPYFILNRSCFLCASKFCDMVFWFDGVFRKGFLSKFLLVLYFMLDQSSVLFLVLCCGFFDSIVLRRRVSMD
jgi:hypothetical protein